MNIGFVLREAAKGLARNITMTIALVITTAISLALLATGFLVTNMTAETKQIYLDRVEVMIQLDEEISAGDEDCSSTECQEVYEALDGADGVESITFRSREQSYERFVEVFQNTDPELVKDTDKDALPAALHVRLTDPLDTTPLEAVEDMPQVAEVVDQVDDLRGATDNLDSVRNATFLLAAVQALAAVFLIANMVQIAAYNRRDEMAIMRMVGASRWYTQAPFILEAVAATLIGAVFSTLGLFLGKAFVVDKALSGLYEARLIAPVTSSDIWLVVPGVVLVGIIFAALTAEITLRAYVRK
ncbi:ABC transporter permease [Corynebacterium sp. zg-331]|uniref:permease-like cell division protein FtsX n=1 Tax=unclassified Corynebacterium TaxID=2624378 RepID=UPI00128BC48F|nr:MULTISPECIES: permease-like cell division protein FtsX [unclassified Corynebacterium]MBC3185855.1 ABC transporter permease [Corynebacterium sp. zg-331]MPV52346.1 FtsX-like permease family protein [Corynebacterium sp. zg331]